MKVVRAEGKPPSRATSLWRACPRSPTCASSRRPAVRTRSASISRRTATRSSATISTAVRRAGAACATRPATRARGGHAAPPPCRAHRHRGARPRRLRADARGLRGRAGRSHDARNAAMSSSPSDERMPRSAKVAVTALVIVGAALRLWQYFANASLWIDEIALAENVLRRPLSALLREPLALDQVAPPGFLALAKASTAVFGESEMALRLVPLASGLLALALFPRLSRRFQPAWISVFATALFALTPTLVRYSAEFKPYSTDVAAAVALTLIAFGLGESDAATAIVRPIPPRRALRRRRSLVLTDGRVHGGRTRREPGRPGAHGSPAAPASATHRRRCRLDGERRRGGRRRPRSSSTRNARVLRSRLGAVAPICDDMASAGRRRTRSLDPQPAGGRSFCSVRWP